MRLSHWLCRATIAPALCCAVGGNRPTLHAAGLDARLRPLIDAHRGTVAVAVKHLDTGESFHHRADEPMPTASLVKFPVLIEAYRQIQDKKLDPEKLVPLRQEDKVPGSGILTTHFSPGAQMCVRDLARLMIVYSDNTATNLVLDQIGLQATNRRMEQLGLTHTRLHSKVFRGDTSIAPERSKQFGLGSTTAAEMVKLFELLHQGKLADRLGTEAMLDHLRHCNDRDMLAAELPAGVKLAHKTGAVNAVRCDAGLLTTPRGTIAIAVLTSENQDRRWSRDNAAQRLCGRMGLAVYRHFNPDAVPSTPVVLREGDAQPLVESLQRTLNARLSPSPKLDVDGDFGPQTRAAVTRFQQAHGLPANGVVGRETWQALGALVTPDAARDPEAVNREKLRVRPAESLEGPPLTTCSAWAVGDASSGAVRFGHQATRKLEPASTTKIMTAYVVLRLAAKDSKLLGETMTFSQRADSTPGSTAGLRAGESLTVEQCLYGLMLPSGNDAATALAEHCGPRCNPPDGAKDAEPAQRFIAEMNRTARSLELKDTHFANPHGLTATGHVSSARDLVKLAATALREPLLAKVAGTRQFGVKVRSMDGPERNVVWKNTNQLLGMEGYTGLKTGTTETAGACLVAHGRRGDVDLLVVVLGATSPDARYVDARNLFRWAWSQPPPSNANSLGR